MEEKDGLSRDFLAGQEGEFWMKDQVIFRYPQKVSKKHVISQVEQLLEKQNGNGTPIQVKSLDKANSTWLIDVPESHLWGDEVMIKVHNAPPLPPPGPPIFPEAVFKNTVMMKSAGSKRRLITKAETFKHH